MHFFFKLYRLQNGSELRTIVFQHLLSSAVQPCSLTCVYVLLLGQFELVCDDSQLTSILVAGVGAGATAGQLVVFSCRNRSGSHQQQVRATDIRIGSTINEATF